MTKNDYAGIAAAIARADNLEESAICLANYFQRQDSTFDRAKFLQSIEAMREGRGPYRAAQKPMLMTVPYDGHEAAVECPACPHTQEQP